MEYDFLDKIPKIDKKTSLIFESIVERYGGGEEFSKNDLISLLKDKNILENMKIKYDLPLDDNDPIYSFDIERKKRGRPSNKNKNSNKNIINYSKNININNIIWDKIYIYKYKNFCKYWRYINSNLKVILNQGILNGNIFEDGLVSEKSFSSKEETSNFINKNIMHKLNYGYILTN